MSLYMWWLGQSLTKKEGKELKHLPILTFLSSIENSSVVNEDVVGERLIFTNSLKENSCHYGLGRVLT